MGLGKTITAWEAVRAMPAAESVLVVCPLAVIAHWRRTIEALGDAGRSVVVMNYERLSKLFEVTPEARRKVRSKKGLARAGTAPAFDVVIWDESHRCKNPTAARSKFAAKLNASAGFALWLSATAGQNPLELSYLAPLLAQPHRQPRGRPQGLRALVPRPGPRRHPRHLRQVGLARRPRGLREGARAALRRALPGGLRRRPEDIAGWPEINRILTPIGLDAEARARYDAGVDGVSRGDGARAERAATRAGALAATLRLRQKGSLIRVEGTLDLVLELLENGHQVAVSVSFLESLEALREGLQREGVDCAALHGAMGAAEREAERLRFQRGEARVVLFTVEEGISLHQGEHNDVPRSEVIHDLRWSAIQMAQIEGRCHRDGRFAQVYWTYADDTLEARIAAVVCRRLQSMKAMVGDDVETLREIERLLADARAAEG